MGGVILLALIFGGLGLNSIIKNLPVPTASPQNTPTADLPTSTSIPFTPTTQPTETPIPTPTLGVGSTEISTMDGMTLLYVPKSEFLMGSTDADSPASSDEKPQHSVMVDAFWIDQTEVTNAMYAKCVAEGGCTDVPTNSSSYTHSSYYGNPEFDDYPVLYVDWNMANTYCSWAGRELPTEAQWEKAARGTDGRIYPWGEDISCDKANYQSNCVGDTSPVKNYPNGVSPYGAYDMAGNVWEWVSSLYQPYPYDANDGREDLSSSSSRVLRGGSWVNVSSIVRSAFRYRFVPTLSFNNIGFRCSRSP
jgi:serine/threonine-protein kinase